MMITSSQNPKIKYVVSLREKRQRKRDGLMLVEGYDELALALECGVNPRSLYYCPSLFGEFHAETLMTRLRQSGAELIEVSPRVFEKIAYRQNPDGWMAVVPELRGKLGELKTSEQPLLVVVEAVEKPGNLGAILRSADAAGVDGLILCDPTVDLGNPNVLRSSRGALFSVPIAEASGEEAIRWLRTNQIAILAAVPDAQLLYTDVDLRRPVAIVVGTEKQGLSPRWLEQSDFRVRIPMTGRVNSLNVAQAATLIIYEAVRQRKAKI